MRLETSKSNNRYGRLIALGADLKELRLRSVEPACVSQEPPTANALTMLSLAIAETESLRKGPQRCSRPRFHSLDQDSSIPRDECDVRVAFSYSVRISRHPLHSTVTNPIFKKVHRPLCARCLITSWIVITIATIGRMVMLTTSKKVNIRNHPLPHPRWPEKPNQIGPQEAMGCRTPRTACKRC